MQVNQYYAKLEKAFNQTRRELQKTIEAFYFEYAEENGLSYAAAQRQLSKAEIGNLRDFIDLAMASIGKHNQTVNNMSIKARITRYEALEAQVDAMLRQLYAIDYQAAAEQTMKAVYEDTYYRTWYNIDQYRGFHAAFARVDPHAVEKLLEYPFNGASFSSRLWKQKDHLQTQLMESLTTMMVQGKNPHVLVADFAKKMNSKKFDAYRLLHTESSFLMSEAAHAGYKEDGVEKYQILATLDSKTCEICGDKDGEVYEVGKEITGENMPPFHCFCRCTDIPYYDDDDQLGETRAARDPETGKTVEVPAGMAYKEWKQSFLDVDGSDLRKVSSDDTIKGKKENTLESKVDKVLHGSDSDRQSLGEEILKDYGVSGIPVNVTPMSDHGFCRVRVENGNLTVVDYNLNANDQRKVEYQVKTAFHEAYHASGNNFPTDYGVVDTTRWLNLEETFAETSAHYRMSQYGITDLTPSYPDKLVSMLPRLKQLPEFSGCVKPVDFGKVALEARLNGGGSAWTELSKRVMKKKFSYGDYVVQYFTEIQNDVTGYVDKILENMPASVKYRTDMITDLKKAMDNVNEYGHTLSDNQSIMLNNAVTVAMNRIGVK